MMNKINVGLIGAGRIARVHVENITYRIPQANILVVADVIPEAAEQVATDFNIPSFVTNQQNVFNNPDVEAVIICSSTHTHLQFIREAAEAGKHIFCEKPIGFDLTEIDQVLEIAEHSGVKLQIGFNRRFDPNFMHIHEAIVAGEIGTPHILHIFSRDPAPPPKSYIETSGGIFVDMMIHDFDMARYLIGSEIESVYAVGGVMIDPVFAEAGDIDTAIVTLQFENGTVGTIDNSRQAVYGYDQRVEVFGSKGNLIASNNTPNNITLSNSDGVHSAKPLYFFLERYSQAYVNEIQSFIEAIVDNTDPLANGLDGRTSVAISQAATKSFQEKRPVKLSEI